MKYLNLFESYSNYQEFDKILKTKISLIEYSKIFLKNNSPLYTDREIKEIKKAFDNITISDNRCVVGYSFDKCNQFDIKKDYDEYYILYIGYYDDDFKNTLNSKSITFKLDQFDQLILAINTINDIFNEEKTFKNLVRFYQNVF